MPYTYFNNGLNDDNPDAAPPPADGGDSGGYYSYGDGSSYDWQSGIFYDQYGNAWDVIGSGVFDTPTLYIGSETTYAPVDLANYDVNLAHLDLPVQLPDVSVPGSFIRSLYDDGTPPPGLNLPPVYNAVPPNIWAKIKQAAKAQAQKAAATSGGGSSSGASASKPAQVAPNKTTGQCPAGYVLGTANGKPACLLVDKGSNAQTWSGFLQNPLYVILAVIAIAYIAKK